MRLTKTLLTGATALSLLAGPALAQQGYGGNPQHNGDHGPMGGPGNWGIRIITALITRARAAPTAIGRAATIIMASAT